MGMPTTVSHFRPLTKGAPMAVFASSQQTSTTRNPAISGDTLCKELLQAVFATCSDSQPAEICIGVNTCRPKPFRGVLLKHVEKDCYEHTPKVRGPSQVSNGKGRFCIYAEFVHKDGEEFFPISNQHILRESEVEKLYFKLYAYQDRLPDKIFELGTFKVSRMSHNEDSCFENTYCKTLLFADVPD